MAAKSKAKSVPASRANSAGVLSKLGKMTFLTSLLATGVAGGYLLRSYAPLPLPFESPLVADASSKQVRDVESIELARAEALRAERAEADRDQLAERLRLIERENRTAERELAELKIKTVLSGE